MPDTLSAFHVGELVEVASESEMQHKLLRFTNGDEVRAALKPHIGKRLRITRLWYPHGKGVLYMLEGIALPIWEECLVDWAIDPNSPHRCAAIDVYNIAVEHLGGESYMTIRDKAGKLYSQTWHGNPELARQEAVEIAKLRCKVAFEFFYRFSHSSSRI